jgi:hypothetical protein
MNQQGNGTGPSLQDPDDTIANSDAAYHAHQNKVTKVTNTVGDGPFTRRTSDAPCYEHFEHREHGRSPGLIPHQPEPMALPLDLRRVLTLHTAHRTITQSRLA